MKSAAPQPAKYPNVLCAHHSGPPEPGYAVCVHIIEYDAVIAQMDPATHERLGVIACARCQLLLNRLPAVGEVTNVDSFRTVCAHCVRELALKNRAKAQPS